MKGAKTNNETPSSKGFIDWASDNARVAKIYLWSGLCFLALGGLLAMVMRWQWAFPGKPVPLVGELLYPNSGGAVTPSSYTGLFTSHGLIMIFFAITPLLTGALGTFVVPRLLGARNLALPRLSLAALLCTLVAQALALASILAPLPASSGWTMYPPLSTGQSSEGNGQTLIMLAVAVVAIASVFNAVNLITTVVVSRREGMGWLRMPLTVWGFFLTSVLNALFVPVLAVATGLLLLDRLSGTQFFQPSMGDPVLYQHLFWLFGHPEVYILILPIWGVVGDLFAFFARKPAYWYRGSVYAMAAVTTLSGLVYGHHLYQSGLGPMLGSAFEGLTLAIAAPSTVLVCNWLCTLWRGRLRLEVPMLFALGTLLVFVAGGLTGLYLGAISTDIYLHDSLWVVGHFHLVMGAATLLGFFAAIYYWYPAYFGRQLNQAMGRIHFAGTLVFALLLFGGLLWAGYSGQGRRLFDPFQYEFLVHLKKVNRHTSYAAFALGAFQLVFVFNFFWSLCFGKVVSENPWEVPTLDWREPGPEPVVRGPHEFLGPKEVTEYGKDWLSQCAEDGWAGVALGGNEGRYD